VSLAHSAQAGGGNLELLGGHCVRLGSEIGGGGDDVLWCQEPISIVTKIRLHIYPFDIPTDLCAGCIYRPPLKIHSLLSIREAGGNLGSSQVNRRPKYHEDTSMRQRLRGNLPCRA
jgi:hypothetical protein